MHDRDLDTASDGGLDAKYGAYHQAGLVRVLGVSVYSAKGCKMAEAGLVRFCFSAGRVARSHQAEAACGISSILLQTCIQAALPPPCCESATVLLTCRFSLSPALAPSSCERISVTGTPPTAETQTRQ